MTTFFHARLHPDDDGVSGPHARVVVYAGPDADHRALLGMLTCLRTEVVDLLTRLNDPARNPICPDWCAYRQDNPIRAHEHSVIRHRGAPILPLM